MNQVPFIFKNWINIKQNFSETYNTKCMGMTKMLEYLKMKLIGHHHSGIDYTRNIARIMIKINKVFNSN